MYNANEQQQQQQTGVGLDQSTDIVKCAFSNYESSDGSSTLELSSFRECRSGWW